MGRVEQPSPGYQPRRVHPSCSSWARHHSLQPSVTASVLYERILPAQAGEACEVAVRRAECTAVLDRSCREMSIRTQHTACMSFEEHPTQDRPMTLCRIQQTNIRLFEPSLNDLECTFHLQPSHRNALVRGDTQKGHGALQWDAYLGGRREYLFEPGTGSLMKSENCSSVHTAARSHREPSSVQRALKSFKNRRYLVEIDPFRKLEVDWCDFEWLRYRLV